MSDVADLFAKKKKKGKKSKKSKKDKKDKTEKTKESSDPSKSSSGGWTSSTTQYKSIVGAKKSKSTMKKTLAVEQTEEEVKFEGMTEKEYNTHVDENTAKKDFHKARLLADAKAKMESDKPATEAVSKPATVGWRAKMEQRQQASSTNIRKQIGNAAHFPSLGGNAQPTNSWTSSKDEPTQVTSSKPAAGAWGSMVDDEDIKKEVAETLHAQDPEVIKAREEEAKRQRKIAQEIKDTWKPAENEGGINDKIENSFIERKVTSMIKEYLNVGDINEVILCIKEFRNPSKHGFVLQRIFEEAFEALGDDSVLSKIADLIVALRKNKKKTIVTGCEFKGTGFILTKGQMVETVEFLSECMEDIKVDVPQAPARFEFICKQLKIKQVLPGLEKSFMPSASFDGAKDGYDFKAGAQGTGYYLQKEKDNKAAAASVAPVAPVAARAKVDPFGGAAPVKSNPFGDATAVTTGVASKPASKPKVVKAKVDPFGGAKPVKKKVNPFGDAVAKDTGMKTGMKTETKTKTETKPVKKVKANPFGDAKPVDTADTSMYGAKKKKKKKKGGYVA
tara:strand:+ start:68 stop:1750 length:1683 start_codon:yes stop_codon:yes gene_type:complete